MTRDRSFTTGRIGSSSDIPGRQAILGLVRDRTDPVSPCSWSIGRKVPLTNLKFL